MDQAHVQAACSQSVYVGKKGSSRANTPHARDFSGTGPAVTDAADPTKSFHAFTRLFVDVLQAPNSFLAGCEVVVDYDILIIIIMSCAVLQKL